jgi:hypothetical protein
LWIFTGLWGKNSSRCFGGYYTYLYLITILRHIFTTLHPVGKVSATSVWK